MRKMDAEIKAFVLFDRQPLLYWTLLAYREAGIRSLILCFDAPRHINRAVEVATSAGYTGHAAKIVLDRGLGVSGLPYVAERYLAPAFLFDASHSCLPASIYRGLIRLYRQSGRAVSYASRADPDNVSRVRLSQLPYYNLPREYVSQKLSLRTEQDLALSLPMVLERRHLDLMYAMYFHNASFLASLVHCGDLALLIGESCPEFDSDREMGLLFARLASAL
jgi:hypothetical protein